MQIIFARFRSPAVWLGILLIANIIIGLLTFRHYGVSYDEDLIYLYAVQAQQAYAGIFTPGYEQSYIADLKYYGPFYFMFVDILVRVLRGLGITIPTVDFWHLTYFMTFQMALFVFYHLCKRWMSSWAALAVTALLSSQPLLWGHSFMNPKDIPFLSFFIFTLYTGLRLLDYLTPHQPAEQNSQSLIQEWQSLSAYQRQKNFRAIWIAFGIAGLIVLTHPLWVSILHWGLENAFRSDSASISGIWLRKFVSNPEPTLLENYVNKASIWLTWLETALAVLTISGLTAYILHSLPRTRIYLSQPVQQFFKALVHPSVLLAGLFLGVTTSIRLSAPIIGVLVFFLAFWKNRSRAVPGLLAYAGIAILTVYATWPFLWGKPLKSLLKSMQVMSAFSQQGDWRTYPTLLSIQLTESTILLMVLGFFILLWRIKSRQDKEFWVVFGVWAALPLAALLIGQKFLYDNFRQMMFTLPGLLTLTGFGFQEIFSYLKQWYIQLVFIVIIAGFGWVACFHLHPYQYVYYNNVSGGLVAADSQEQMTDYWGISFKEAAHFLNQHALAGARVIVCGPPEALQVYLRSDISVSHNCQQSLETGYDYAVLNSRGQSHVNLYPAQPVIYTIGYEQVVFTVIKDLRKK